RIPVRGYQDELLECLNVLVFHSSHEGFGRRQRGFVDEIVVVAQSGGSRSEDSNEKQHRETFGMFHRTILRVFLRSASILGRNSSNPGRSIRQNVSFFPY